MSKDRETIEDLEGEIAGILSNCENNHAGLDLENVRLKAENAKLRKVVEYHAMMGSLLARGVLEEVEKND
jgi:hypothetical protein